MLALALPVLLATTAVAVDLGYGRHIQLELQSVADAAAHAGAAQLDGTIDGMGAARAMALELAAANRAASTAVTLDPNTANDPSGDVVTGIWNDALRSFAPSADFETVNAVQVRARAPALGLIFAPVAMGRGTIPVSADAIMVKPPPGASEVTCWLPFALPACLVDYHTLDGMQDVTLNLNPPGIDNVGWARPNGAPNANWSRDQLLDCEQGGTASVGDPVGLQNGNVTSALAALVDAVTASETRWNAAAWGEEPAPMANSSVPADAWGHTYEGVVMVFDGGSSYCSGSGGSFTGSAPLAGFMWAAVYDVANQGSSASRSLRMRLDVLGEHEVGARSGAADWGVTGPPAPPRMVDSY